MADSSFRVLLDLTSLYIENFKYVWINVSPRELKTIADFKSSILQKINLDQGDIKLFVRDGLLLDEETVLVLREDDTVKVQYDESFQSSAMHNSEKGSKKYAKKRNISESSISSEMMNPKKKKVENNALNKAPDINSAEKNKEKKKKCKKSHSSLIEEKTVDLSENFGENVHGKTQSLKKKRKNEPVLIESSTVDNDANQNYDAFFSFETENPATELHDTNIPSTSKTVNSNDCTFNADSNLISEVKDLKNQLEKTKNLNEAPEVVAEVTMSEEVNDNHPKRKRKRRRKRKNEDSSVSAVSLNTSGTSFLVSGESNLEKQHENFESTIFNVSGNMDSLDKSISFKDKAEENVQRKHIVYKHEIEKDPVVLGNAKEGFTKTFAVRTTLSLANAPSFKDYPRVSTPNQSNACDKPNWCVSLMEGRCSLKNNELEIRKNEREPIKNCTVSKPLLNEDISGRSARKKIFSPEINYEGLPALNSIPEIGDHIAYKSLELDESYSPTISDYKEGIVKNVNPDTDEIEIEFFVGVVKPGRTGKFENLKEDEFPIPEVKTCDIIKWSSIISPKRLSKLPN